MGSPTVALVGERNPTNRSHLAFDAVMARLPFGINASWLPTDEVARIPDSALGDLDGIWMASGSPYRNLEGALRAIRFARERDVPLLGTCGGFQHVVLEYMRTVAGATDAAHAEQDPDASGAVIVPLTCSLFAQRRWVQTVPGTRAAAICGLQPMDGYHFCGYGVASQWISRLESAGLVISGYADDAGVEIVELPTHPFYIGSAFQPQVGPDGAPETGPLHPLILAFAEAVSRFHGSRAVHASAMTSAPTA
jgi:CTP synthase (UTP-ammonia lyase)